MFLGFTSVTTDGSGNASYSTTLPGIVPAGASVAATATDPAGDTSEFSSCFPPPTTPPGPPPPNSSFRALARPSVNTSTGAIRFTESVSNPGNFSWRLTFRNGPNGVFAVDAPKRCPTTQVKLRGKCRPSRILFGRGSITVTAPGRVVFTVKPSAAAAKALKSALKYLRGVNVTAVLRFQSARGGVGVSHTQTIIVKIKKANKRKK
jgi:hypothetical protein